jgi:hypothetical protein
MNLSMLNNLPVLKIQRGQIMYRSSQRHYMVLNKHHVLGFKNFGTFLSQRDLRLQRYSYAKFMLMILYLDQPIKNFVKNLVI